MLVIVYDITDKKRLRKVAKYFESKGIRTQKSVFELDMSFAKGKKILKEIDELIDSEVDKCFLFEIKNREDLAQNTDFSEIM